MAYLSLAKRFLTVHTVVQNLFSSGCCIIGMPVATRAGATVVIAQRFFFQQASYPC
jgi:hypothetical protein